MPKVIAYFILINVNLFSNYKEYILWFCVMVIFFFFYSCFRLYGNLPYTYPPPFSLFLRLSFLIPCHFLPYRQSHPPWECDRSHSVICCIAFAEGHRVTAENLCRYSRLFNKVCPQYEILWKMTSRSAFRCAGCGPAVTHPSEKLLDLGGRLTPDT